MQDFHVVIIGAGLGGLCLAQGLKRAGIRFDVYERDPAADSRLQGYRIRIDTDGQRALEACLPQAQFDLFRATASSSPRSGRFLTPQLQPVAGPAPMSWDTGEDEDGGDLSVNRLTLREILLAGIEDHVHFDRALTQYRCLEDGRVEIQFENASVVSCDLLVGADGVNSQVRRQLAPYAEPADTGSICVYGRSELPRDEVPASAASGFSDGEVPTRRQAECLSEHGDEAAGACISQAVGDLRDRIAGAQMFKRKQQPRLLPPVCERHACFDIEKPPGRSFRYARPLCQGMKSFFAAGVLQYGVRYTQNPPVRRHRQM